MEAVAVLVFGAVVLLAVAAPILAIAALFRVSRLERRLDALAVEVHRHRHQPAQGPPRGPSPILATAPPPSPPPTPSGGLDEPSPAAAEPRRPAPPDAPPAEVGPLSPPPPPVLSALEEAAPTEGAPVGKGGMDFVSSLGPRILVAAGGLAVVVFLGFFVRYAWENNWVGPTGRVLLGAVFSLGLVTLGLRLLGREYRPLGQGLAAAGFAGLYISAYAAHGVYGLAPRGFAGLVMVAVTACAVAVADRLDTRLLAVLAWVGAYLAPVLLSTGEDRAVSLFGYLLLLGAGALWLDRRKPWPETLPLAATGTLLLYGAWYAAHFRPERFGVAAVGLVLFTGLFALGSARKERAAGFGAVFAAAGVGLAFLGADAGRPEVLLPLSLVLAAVGLRAAAPFGVGVALASTLVVALPFLAWASGHYSPESFGLAAAWLVGGAALFILGSPAETSQPIFPVGALVAGGAASVELAARTDRPAALLALLVAQAGLALLARRRWEWAGPAALALGAAATFAWYAEFFDAARTGDLLMLGLVLAGTYATASATRGLVLGAQLRLPDAVSQILAAGLAWLVLERVLGLTHPQLRGAAAAGLAALHLALGLSARRRPEQALWTRVTLALAAVFLTLAIPVQLGLFGITLAWAGEAVVLVWLGVRHGSRLARVGGYGVLLLAVGRLLVRHLPLHDGAFIPVLNPVFGTWLLVISAVAVTRLLAGPARRDGSTVDVAAGALLGPLGLALLLGLLTAETREFFGERVRVARAAGDSNGIVRAGRQSDLALSVLWTAFATGLLAAGLGLRSRGLFYAAYGLFGVTAIKVVLVDLATLPTLYRMFSFLALGVLLLAGAWLNLRFRERLATPGSPP